MGQVPEKRSLASRWVLWCILFVAVVLLYIVSMTDIGYQRLQPRLNTAVPVQTTTPSTPSTPSSWSSFVVDTPGCRIPALDPMDAAVRQYVKAPSPLHCDSKGRQLVASNLTALFVVDSALPDYNVSDTEQLDCCYRPFHRVEGNISKYSYGVDDKIKYNKKCIHFKREVAVEVEFVKVVCMVAGVKVYEDYHGFVPAKGRRVVGDPAAVSVLMLGIDAVSRLNFHRQMPLTAARLRDMGAIEMLGYNKVGDNTFPNLVPVLSGLSEQELRDVCWPNDNTAFDSCPWIWKNYSALGYATGFGEDAPWMGIFSYIKVGFVKQPTDYYMRPYSKTAEDKIGYKKELNAKLCVGCRMTPEVLLEYTGKFSKSMVSVPSFGLFWSASLTHDFLNYPRLADELYANYLRDLDRWGVLNRTVLVFMSDHGIRWGDIRETYQGRMEERLPLLYFIFPEWFRERYTAAVANVRRNTHRLTSPFDLFETLADLLHPDEQLEQATVRRRANERRGTDPPPRGTSLFLPVAEDRTCAQAGIDPHWCTCQQSQPVDTNSTIVRRTATFLVKHLNRLLQPYPQCAQLHLQSVQDAQLELPLEHLHTKTKDQGLHDYLIVVHTVPGNGAFEATIRHRPGDDSLNVAGAVSRINAYGKQSICVDEFHLKLYCYCLS